jgi:hypothetical protein
VKLSTWEIPSTAAAALTALTRLGSQAGHVLAERAAHFPLAHSPLPVRRQRGLAGDSIRAHGPAQAPHQRRDPTCNHHGSQVGQRRGQPVQSSRKVIQPASVTAARPSLLASVPPRARHPVAVHRSQSRLLAALAPSGWRPCASPECDPPRQDSGACQEDGGGLDYGSDAHSPTYCEQSVHTSSLQCRGRPSTRISHIVFASATTRSLMRWPGRTCMCAQ